MLNSKCLISKCWDILKHVRQESSGAGASRCLCGGGWRLPVKRTGADASLETAWELTPPYSCLQFCFPWYVISFYRICLWLTFAYFGLSGGAGRKAPPLTLRRKAIASSPGLGRNATRGLARPRGVDPNSSCCGISLRCDINTGVLPEFKSSWCR